jgi:hypothetical protein
MGSLSNGYGCCMIVKTEEMGMTPKDIDHS